MEKTNERLRNLSWEDYGIDKERYRELKHFCLQYKGKKKKASASLDYNLPAVSLESSGGHTGKVSKPVEDAAIKHMMRVEKYLRDCRMIEEAAMRAASTGGYRKAWRAILRSVTEGMSYESVLLKYESVPYSKTDFYAVRRAFFYILDEMQSSQESQEIQGFEGSEKSGTN